MERESSKELLSKLQECAKQTKLARKMFLGFGTLLGAIRERSVIEHDDDMDVCFINIGIQDKQNFLEKCQRAGLFSGWKEPQTRICYKPDGEILWFSVKLKHKGPKCCVWFFVEWANVTWHTKGKMWVSNLYFDRAKHKFYDEDDAVMKGAYSYLFDNLIEIDFLDGKYQIPVKSGELLDFWYPNWFHPKEACESCYKLVCRVPKWYNNQNWKLI